MLKLAIPVLHVSNSAAAEEFYCNKLGFTRLFEYQPDSARPDPRYIGLARDEATIHLSSFSGDGVAGGIAYIITDDLDTLYSEFIERDAPVDLEPTEQSWGNREVYINDPDGNSLRFVFEHGG